MRICTAGIVGFLLLGSLRGATAQPVSSVAAERVTVPSGTARLTGLLWKPTGTKPFPAVLFNHGGRTNDLQRAEILGPIFAKHGYAFLYLFRRGYGLSADQGEYMWDVLDREEEARGEGARKRLQFTLLTTDHLDDATAGLKFVKRLPGVDARRIAVAGHSFGGVLALLSAERDKDVRAAVTFGAAAQQWDGSPDLQQRMLAAARNLETPLFVTHAANDYSIAPGQTLSAELTRLKRPHELKIYPAVGETPRDGHQAVYTDITTWEADVFRFLDASLRSR
jgi:carboxymethylenebutenolidase